LDSCDACRAELEDLRTFKGASAAYQHPEPPRRELERRKRRRGLTVAQTAAAATLFVAATSAVAFWWGWGRGKPLVSKISAAAPAVVAAAAPRAIAGTAPAAVAAAASAPHTASMAPAAGPQPHDTQLVKAAAPTTLGSPAVKTTFALLGPLGESVPDTRPEFHWEPLAGAIRYSVAIVDTGLHPVQRSHALRTTVWRPRRPLRRGQTYLWQVTATLRGGSRVVASEPLPSAALIRIQSADEVKASAAQNRQGSL
jgi:hypothetical protein